MNINKNIIADLYPLYAENECSADTRALVEEYLRANPGHAEELRRVMTAPLPPTRISEAQLDEVGALQKARRAVRRRSWIMGLAIFFSLAPFSILYTGGKTYWLLLDSPLTAILYGGAGIMLWIIHLVMKRRFNEFRHQP